MSCLKKYTCDRCGLPIPLGDRTIKVKIWVADSTEPGAVKRDHCIDCHHIVLKAFCLEGREI